MLSVNTSGSILHVCLAQRWYSSFSRKRSKKRCSASRKVVGYPNLGEADPGGLGACPQQNSTLSGFLLFPEKEAKSVVPLRGRLNKPRGRMKFRINKQMNISNN
jgi:hypothetical protein